MLCGCFKEDMKEEFIGSVKAFSDVCKIKGYFFYWI